MAFLVGGERRWRFIALKANAWVKVLQVCYFGEFHFLKNILFIINMGRELHRCAMTHQRRSEENFSVSSLFIPFGFWR